MVLDMEGEFFKIARTILSKPGNLYKMAAISPHTGRVTLLGADGFMVVGSSVLRTFTRGREEKAFSVGEKCGREMFGNLMKEFDEEIRSLEPRKLFQLALSLARNTGWGSFDMVELKASKKKATIRALETIEMRYQGSKHHMLTCGFVSGIASICLGSRMKASIEKETESEILLSLSPA